MKKIIVSLLFILVIFTLVGCGGGGNSGPTGNVTGYIKAADGVTPIVGASVTAMGTSVTTTTNGQGLYNLTGVPVGNQKIIATKGSYRVDFNINITEGQTVTAPTANLVPVGKIGVLQGVFDNFRDVLTQLGVAYEVIDTSIFANSNTVNQYSVIFFECGSSYIPDATDSANLKSFVDQGGSIYASDWEGDIIDAVFPGKINFAGKIGDGTQNVTGTILDQELISLLGKNQANIYYDLDSWNVIDSVGDGVNILVKGSITAGGTSLTDKPLLVEFKSGSGYVIYTTFHNEAQVTQDVQKILKHLAFEL